MKTMMKYVEDSDPFAVGGVNLTDVVVCGKKAAASTDVAMLTRSLELHIELVAELEARWPVDFARTRSNRLRRGDEIELNFFYHHYLRAARYPVLPMGAKRIEFLYAQRCAKSDGYARCAKLLRTRDSDFVTFNDDATTQATLDAGLASLHRLLAADYGTFCAPGG